MNNASQTRKKWTPEPRTVRNAMIAFALLAPFGFFLSSIPQVGVTFAVFAITWQMTSLGGWPTWAPVTSLGPFVILFAFLRLLFAHEMNLCYQTLATRKRAILVGVISELQIVIVDFPSYLTVLSNPTSPLLDIIGPIPLLLLFGLVVLIVAPPPRALPLWTESDASVD